MHKETAPPGTLSLCILFFLAIFFLELFINSMAEVLEKLLTEIIISLQRIILTAIGTNRISIEQVIGA
jgi:hypothetical protein